MRNIYIIVVACLLPLSGASGQTKPKSAGDYIESTSYNEHQRGAKRSLQYYPEGEDFVCVNGQNRYTRALYGSISPFRLETSDRPVFAAYDKQNSKNIRFRLRLTGISISLDSVAYCESRYTAGRRSYRLTDPSWGRGELRISVLAFPDADGAIWQFEPHNMPAGAELLCHISNIKAKRLSRNGDMGADPADSFEASESQESLRESRIQLGKTACYVELKDLSLNVLPVSAGKASYDKAEEARLASASRIRFNTPDAFFNTLGGALAVAADGIWDGEVWLHGAVGWRMPLSGWRAAYTGDVLGRHDRARTHFNAYAASQVTEVPNTISHPAQDPEMNLARSEKRWGTSHYSNGYICRNPRRNDQMHHYDMNLCYIDELLWHLNWTGDLEYARKMWPVLTRHLAWEKLNFDPNNDGLYDAYACIWASDALYYNSGAVTHSTAYNYRANKMAAEIAAKIGENPEPYQTEASRILKALNNNLWLPEKGHWAEFRDFMGHRRLHENAAVWTIYHAIDSDTADPFQAWQATRYVDTEIPHIPVRAVGLKDEGYATISTTDWLPYSWSINNVAFAEVMHTSLAYFQAGRNEEAFKLLKSSVLDGMYLGNSPGNFGQVSFYDAARGECYRDFGDPIGVASRAFIQGLFGLQPDAMNGQFLIRPGFPQSWSHAALQTPDISFDYQRGGNTDVYKIEHHFSRTLTLELKIQARMDKLIRVTANGRSVQWKLLKSGVGSPLISIAVPADKESEIKLEIEWGGNELKTAFRESAISYKSGDPFELTLEQEIQEIHDPQKTLAGARISSKNKVTGRVSGLPGHRTFFVKLRQGDMLWWQPIDVPVELEKAAMPEPFTRVIADRCEPVVMDNVFNASVTDIFHNEYLTPRSPYTTLQLPVQGIGEWCHPKTMADIDDSGVRASVRDGLLATPWGVSFRTPSQGKNIAFTSLWDNYPDKLSVPLSGKASQAYLLMAGSTNHMQCHIVNGTVRVQYKDGSTELLNLINPENWCPIEQDFFVDNIAFKLKAPRPYRLHLKSGLISNDLEKDLNITGVYGRSIDGGAGILLEMPLNVQKELESLTVETLSNDVVIGLMGVTLQRE